MYFGEAKKLALTVSGLTTALISKRQGNDTRGFTQVPRALAATLGDVSGPTAGHVRASDF